MTIVRQMMPASIKMMGEDEVEVRVSTAVRARDGHILIPQGARLDNYRRNPVVLWNHDVSAPPVARSESIAVEGEEIVSRAKFPPLGISARADEIRGLTKAGFINGASIGFDPIDGEPIEKAKPKGGMRVSDWELVEWSFCCIPVDPGAEVTARALVRSEGDWKCGVSKDLPVEDSDSWDGSAAEASIFKWAGGDDFDPSKARKGFLAYNAAKPKERGSYKLPLAHVVDGRLKVPKGAIRAAASRLSQADIPEGVKETAQAVIDHYEEKAGMAKSKGAERAVVVKHQRAIERAPSVPSFKRGLYEVSYLASLLGQLGYATDCAEWEAEIEEDESQVPTMLGEALKQLGEALIAMTEEEVQELLAFHEEEGAEEMAEGADRAYILEGKTPAIRAWRRGIVMARAGKAISASNAEKLGEAQDHHTRAMKHHGQLGDHHAAVGEHLGKAEDAMSRAVKSHGEVGEALQAAKDEPDKAAEHVGKALKAHRSVGTAHEQVADAHANAQDRHADVGDSHAALGRCVRSATRCVRAVVEGATPGGEDSDSKEVQTSSGTGESKGSANDRSRENFTQRQGDLAVLTRAARMAELAALSGGPPA